MPSDKELQYLRMIEKLKEQLKMDKSKRNPTTGMKKEKPQVGKMVGMMGFANPLLKRSKNPKEKLTRLEMARKRRLKFPDKPFRELRRDAKKQKR